MRGIPQVQGLDAIRFLAAVWVVLSHFGLPPIFAGASRETHLGYAVTALYKLLVCGPAAVIVFFVVSGFCIHQPYKNAPPTSWRDYFARRYIRIGTPLLGILVVCELSGYGARRLHSEILWSLYAEIAYYTVYPVLRTVRERFGWKPVFLGSIAAAVAVLAAFPHSGNFHGPGVAFTWLLGLPAWLLGCLLAERFQAERVVTRRRIWLMRGAVWAASAACLVLRFRSPIGYVWTLLPFAVLVFFWLREELPTLARKAPPAWMERAGQWSYSIYVVHMLVAAPFVERWNEPLTLAFGHLLAWGTMFGSILLSSYVFYRLVERPSHMLARKFRSREPASAAELSVTRETAVVPEPRLRDAG